MDASLRMLAGADELLAVWDGSQRAATVELRTW